MVKQQRNFTPNELVTIIRKMNKHFEKSNWLHVKDYAIFIKESVKECKLIKEISDCCHGPIRTTEHIICETCLNTCIICNPNCECACQKCFEDKHCGNTKCGTKPIQE